MVSSARNPNESYAQRAKKASTSSTLQTPQQKQNQPAIYSPSTTPSSSSSSLKPPQVNVWTERIREQNAQPSLQPPQLVSSSPQPLRDDPIQPRSSSSDLSAQLAILDQQDEHDPFVIRVPPHLSRQSSSSTNPLPVADPTAWPHLPGADRQNNTAHYDPPFPSTVLSRHDSTASSRLHTYSSAGSVHLSRVQSSLSQHSHSASHSRPQSRSGSSASSPRLQIRGRTLPQDDTLLPDLRLDNRHRRSSNQRSSPALPDSQNQILTSFQTDSVPSADPSCYQLPLVPPLQDMPPHYTSHFVPQYALPQHFSPSHAPGHTSPYFPPHSGQGTPPYSHYPPYPTYMYGHPSLFWGDVPSPHSHNHFQGQPLIPSNYIGALELPILHTTEFSSVSPAVTLESSSSKESTHDQQDWLQKPPKNVVFGTINLAEPQSDSAVDPLNEEDRTETAVEYVAEQFTTFSIGVGPNEHGPPRLASRKQSIRSLAKPTSQSINSDGSQGANLVSAPLPEANGIKKPIKWEFGTTLSEDLEDPLPQLALSLPSSPSPSHLVEFTSEDQYNQIGVSSSVDILPVNRLVSKSETESSTSDVWVVKDYGYGFGEHGRSGYTSNVVRREREKERAREIIRDRDRGWTPARPSGWRYENGSEGGREVLEQSHMESPRPARPRRGSFPGYGGHERGGLNTRRGRGFGGRFHGGRARGGFFHHQRPGSYTFAQPPPPPPIPPLFEMIQPTIDMVNGYGHSSYVQQELEAVPPAPESQPRAPLTSTAYSIDAMQNCLLGQLEYYLSPQNMAQDLYLRQRMDNEGWIPISLLASFKRVQQLHMDTNTVREVLSRSSTVEVSGDWVRMEGKQWEVFLLPNAPRSVVTNVDPNEGKGALHDPHYGRGAYPREFEGEHGETEGDCDGEDCEGDDEDDDVEFVIGEEAEGSWMSVAERKQ